MDSSIILDSVDDLFLEQAQGLDESYNRLINLRNDAPKPAPNNLTYTPVGGIAKPIGLKEVADLYGVAPRMSNLRGKGPAPNTGSFGLSIFEGEGGATRMVGKAYIDRWDDLISNAGLFPKPNYSWDRDDSTNIGYPTGVANWSGNLSNGGFFVFGLLANPDNVVSIQKITVQLSVSHRTVDGFDSIGYWVPQHKTQGGSWAYGKPWQSRSQSTDRNIVSNSYSVVSNGAINPAGWPSTSDWYGVKSWVANGFLMNFTNRDYDTNPSPNKEAALCNSFQLDIDITVKM